MSNIVYSNRASAVLYNFLVSNKITKPFLLPANVCPVVPMTFMLAKIPFRFVDIDESHAIDKKKCIELFSTGVFGGIVFVHAYGHVFENTCFYSLIKNIDNDIIIVDDRCLCVPSFICDDENIDCHVAVLAFACKLLGSTSE